MTKFRLPHEYVMRLNAELRSRHATWIEGERAEKISRAFVAAASMADLFEMRVAELALAQGGEKVRPLAQSLLQERRQQAQRLRSTLKIASLGDVDHFVPYQLDPRREHLFGKLSGTSDEEDFGTLFIHQQRASHEEAISIFCYYAVYGENEALRAFARITLPFLERRLDQVAQLT
ncbi:DUF4142 domain-containing protein [Hyphomonas sp. NPDC076900]|uniref:DUF4142 domain-containing protein n=1 Tax=unclassified Hyphomonas TaxID=2630699 RepID=UPI003D019F02